MTRTILAAHKEDLAQAMRTMLRLQQEYFELRKNGLEAHSNKAKAITAEHHAASLCKELAAHLPVIIEADIKELVPEYKLFLLRCAYLIGQQRRYWDIDRSRKQLQKCKALERDMRQYLKQYFSKQATQTTLL